MITFTNGDMFSINANCLVNTVNCVGIMGAGVALAFKQRFPIMFEDYKKACDLGEIKPGKLHIWENSETIIINFPTKRHWRNKSRYEDIKLGLDALRVFLNSRPNLKVALPALGCGHGGLDWQIVSAMIEKELSEVNAEIQVFNPQDTHNLNTVMKSPKNADNNKENAKMIPNGYFPDFVTAYYIGNLSLLRKDNKIIISANIDTEKEKSIFHEILQALYKKQTNDIFSLVYRNSQTNFLIQEIIKEGYRAIIYLPFGIQHLPPILENFKNNTNILFISLYSPNQEWRENTNESIQNLLLDIGYKFLITEKEPGWVIQTLKNNVNSKNIFFIKYENSRSLLQEYNKNKTLNFIGKSIKTKEPNIDIIFDKKNEVIKEKNEITLNFKEINELMLKLEQYNIQDDVLYKVILSQSDKLVNEVIHNILKDLKIKPKN